MTDKKCIKGRRKLLKSMASASSVIVAAKSLPEDWSRPIVDSVILPAHAQTSVCKIDGVYCWVKGNGATLDLTVQPDGTITIDYVNSSGSRTWIGVGSVPATGGFFDITLTQVIGQPSVRGRHVNGTVVCNSLAISGESIIGATGNILEIDNYTATQATCTP